MIEQKEVETEKDDIKRAYMFFIVNRQSFNGTMDSWAYSINAINKNMTKKTSTYLSIIELLPEIHQRIMKVQIDNRDFRDILKIYDDIDTFFYCDPPYLPETRKTLNKYKYEMSYQDHKDLIDILSNVRGKVMLSGYQNDLYEKLNWRRIDFDTYCHTVNTRLTLKRPKRIESIWINYDIYSNLLKPLFKLRSPLIYYGGKGNLINKLIEYIPEHKKYVEVFGGGASLLFAKRPEGIEVYNDIDYDLFNFFSVLRDKEKFQEFYRLVSLTPYSRNEFNYCKDNLNR